EEMADVVLFFAKIPLLRDLGYKLYGALTRPKQDLPQVGNLGTLTPTLSRGAQPTEKGFETLKSQGVQTVINLRPEANWEAPMVKQQGMNYVYLPLPAVGAPTNEQAMQFLSLVTDPKNGKVFFHCQHGADRTGAMAAAYRIAAQGWTADQAIAEMYQYNFHAGFEDAKLDFVRSFAAYWQGLDSQTKASVLHRSLDLTA
ncbi:MAG TPA: dual specificity protein phosphatase family protein, partial [Stenomitos sp.]